MVKKHKMIEPFAAEVVRDGKVSYGLSSYGYDLRVADEFKVFTNVHSAIVDPKNFDEKSFVDMAGKGSILIPPNSFALTRSLEYLRIPRNVLGLCIGKSTYARCFSGETRVALVDGTAPTLEEMAHRADKGELFWGYSLGEHGRIIVTLLEAPRFIGRDSLIEVTLDNDRAIRCTPDHLFLMRDGQLRTAGDLRPGDSLMPLYRDLYRGYEAVYQPLNGHLYPTHRLADEWNLRQGIYADTIGTHRHHKDFNRLNNNPWNIERMEDVEVVHAFKGTQVRNHKVASTKELPGVHDVYCLTVPEAGNFALEAGVFVRNCGIIVNVTPIQPEWEGYLIIEISNTTPLPAKIYAGEGIAEILFFEAEEVCEKSYKDVAGIYSHQKTIVLPKV